MVDAILVPVSEADDLTTSTVKYEYLDHPADVQIHAWGITLVEAFEQAAIGMFGYMTDITKVEMPFYIDLHVEGEDLKNLLYKYLDELLFLFCAEPNLISSKVKIINFDETNFRIDVRCYGEPFNLDKHTQGTEVKAITYSAMEIYQEANKVDIFYIIDI